MVEMRLAEVDENQKKKTKKKTRRGSGGKTVQTARVTKKVRKDSGQVRSVGREAVVWVLVMG